MHGQRPLMGLQIWWVHPQRSDATLEALVIWWSVGGGGLRNIQSHTHSQQGILFGKWPKKVAWSEPRGHFWGFLYIAGLYPKKAIKSEATYGEALVIDHFCSHFCELSIKEMKKMQQLEGGLLWGAGERRFCKYLGRLSIGGLLVVCSPSFG